MGQGGAIRINDMAPTPGVVNLFDAVMTNGNDIEITGSMVAQGAFAPISTSGAGAVLITSTTGNITLNGTASLGSGQLTIGAANALDLNNTITTQGGDVVITAGQSITAIPATHTGISGSAK